MPVRARAVAWRVLVLAVGARAVVRPLRWVHIPKCGQSWAVTMFDYWCAPADADAAAAFLEASRSPTRVVEAERRFGARLREPDAQRRSFEAYFAKPGLRRPLNCQTKALAGLSAEDGAAICVDRVAVNASAVDRAAALVAGPGAAFVGLLEHWALSVALFHCAFMPDRPVRPAALKNLHPTAPVSRRGAPPRPAGAAQRADWTVYAAGARRFFHDVAAHADCVAAMGGNASDARASRGRAS